jgi:aspartate/methionine/tyrosine aminotransferase
VEAIQVVLDTKLLKASDKAAKRQRINRSAPVRQALREYLRRVRLLDLEERDRRGYQARPQRIEEYLPWEEVACWPEDGAVVMFIAVTVSPIASPSKAKQAC